jgi:hypothetical protein
MPDLQWEPGYGNSQSPCGQEFPVRRMEIHQIHSQGKAVRRAAQEEVLLCSSQALRPRSRPNSKRTPARHFHASPVTPNQNPAQA